MAIVWKTVKASEVTKLATECEDCGCVFEMEDEVYISDGAGYIGPFCSTGCGDNFVSQVD